MSERNLSATLAQPDFVLVGPTQLIRLFRWEKRTWGRVRSDKRKGYPYREPNPYRLKIYQYPVPHLSLAEAGPLLSSTSQATKYIHNATSRHSSQRLSCLYWGHG